MENRTIFIIAQRSNTVVKADGIIVLREGKTIVKGAHLKLISENGYYASLVEKQTAGLLAIKP